MSFHIFCAVFSKSKHENKEQKRTNEAKESLLVIHFSKLEIQFHTNLTLDAVPRKVLLQLVGKRKDSKVVSNIGDDENPVETVEELEIGISIEYKSSVRVDN